MSWSLKINYLKKKTKNQTPTTTWISFLSNSMSGGKITNDTKGGNTVLYLFLSWSIFGFSIHQLLEIWAVSIFLAIMNSTAINIHVQIFVWTYVFNSLRINAWHFHPQNKE